MTGPCHREGVSDPGDADRLPNLLGELRILLQGSQVLTSFLIILPFNSNFDTLSGNDRLVYVATFLCSLISLVLFSAPALHHYLRRPMRHPEEFKSSSGRLVTVGAVFATLALVLSTRLVLARVFESQLAWWVTAATALLLGFAWWWIPLRRTRS